MLQKPGAAKFLHDPLEGGRPQIPRMAREHKGEREGAGVGGHFLLEALVIRVSEAMKCRDRAVLVEIRHKERRTLSAPDRH